MYLFILQVLYVLKSEPISATYNKPAPIIPLKIVHLIEIFA